jgi:large subunit ribosomal protein L23
VVGLVDPFYYPQDLEAMDSAERKEREDWLEERFALGAVTRWRRHEMVRMSQSGSKSKYWRLTGYLRRDKILKEIARRRAITASDLEEVQRELAEQRASGEPILREKRVRAKPAKSQKPSRALTV